MTKTFRDQVLTDIDLTVGRLHVDGEVLEIVEEAQRLKSCYPELPYSIEAITELLLAHATRSSVPIHFSKPAPPQGNAGLGESAAAA